MKRWIVVFLMLAVGAAWAADSQPAKAKAGEGKAGKAKAGKAKSAEAKAGEAAEGKEAKKPELGFSDTPMLPGQKWHVHDVARPQPPVVAPGTCSTQEAPGKAPSDAVVLFDGKDLSKWEMDKGGPAQWKVENGYVEAVPKLGGIRSKETFGDCQLHIEWLVPEGTQGQSQGRGNSGVFLMGLYEIQVLDSYNNPTYADGGAGAIYGQWPPLVNPCRPQGQWQTYDVVWIAPRFDGEKLVSPARETLFFNGVVVHHDDVLNGPTAHKKALPYKPQPPTGPIALQAHGNPVRYRNIWVRPLKGHDEP
ncbi:MAG: DUF1080 domain-containing protein [Candidatus Sumerlaeota bacterium]|nr:DUF1080 domain-containing protein [Candidatus Sumerlaeota bacterium]